MKHEYEYDYADIEAYIRQANELRSQALGQLIRQGLSACQRVGKDLWFVVVHHHRAGAGTSSQGLAA